ncbi:MAG: DUF4870 domain-containing protein [Myxacorys chilensis ATA2-1-KO14]|jgi:hypothetical protein|nr:DUF4870 domain-containing protein [Myxacorys chilensis ATA2-1-KO14]
MNEPLPKNVRVWGIWCHLSGTIAALVGTVLFLPFVTLLLPLIVWRSGRDRHPFIDQQGREAMNFLLSMTLYGIAAGVLSAFLFFATCSVIIYTSANTTNTSENMLMWIGYTFLIGVALFVVFQVVITIFAAIKASKGQSYRYPFSLRFLGS